MTGAVLGLHLSGPYANMDTMRDRRNRESIDRIKENLTPLLNEEGLRLIVLFGSLAAGKTHSGSDVDLGFLFDGTVDLVGLTNKVMRLLQMNEVDVVDLRRTNPVLRLSAVKNGLLLYEREPGMFNQFYSLALRRYLDTRKFRTAQETATMRFLELRGL